MAKIIRASDYGYRKVITVVLNPDDSRWVHTDKSLHPLDNLSNCPNSMVCTNNWYYREFIWTGEDLFYYSDDGDKKVRTGKTDEMLKAEVVAGLKADASAGSERAPTKVMAGLVGVAV